MLDQQTSTEALLGRKVNTSQLSSKSQSPSKTQKTQPVINNQKIDNRSQQLPSKDKKKKKKKNQTQFTSVLRVLNFILGLGVIGFGIACYQIFNASTEKLDFVGLILPGYISFSGLMIVLIQCNFGFIVRNMKFMYNFIGRGLFNIYVGVMPLSLIRLDATPEQDKVFQVVIFIMVSLMVLIGALYILAKILCCAKQNNKRKKSSDQSGSDDD